MSKRNQAHPDPDAAQLATADEPSADEPAADAPPADSHDYTPLIEALLQGTNDIIPVVASEHQYALDNGLSAVAHMVAASILDNVRKSLEGLLQSLAQLKES